MKRFLLLVSFIFTVFVGIAQNGNRLEALKIAYITRKLDLSPSEAEKFWPIYNQYSAEMKQIQVSAYKNNTPEIELDEQSLNLRKKYNAQFAQALPAQKVDLLFKSEKEFYKYVQKEMERRRLKNEGKADNP